MLWVALKREIGMNLMLTQRLCPVRECGATVLMGEVDGRSMALDPTWIDVVVPDEKGKLALTRGLRPHAATCVDISGRAARAAKPGAHRNHAA